MRLKDPDVLALALRERGMSQAELARRAKCKRQFIWQLLHDPEVNTCKPERGLLIEEALEVRRGLLFEREESDPDGQSVQAGGTPQDAGAAA